MNRILLLDVETQGLDPAKDKTIEVGCILYSVEHATSLTSFSSLIHADGNPVEAINRIPPAALLGAPIADIVWPKVFNLAESAEAIVAHNAEFDRSFVPEELRTKLPWICTWGDLVWPKQSKKVQAGSGSLVNLALEHDLGVATAHRALTDCELMARLFTRVKELGVDLNAMLARGLRPKGTFIAQVSFDDKDKAKEAGFKWDAVRKQWKRTMAIEDARLLSFPVKQV